MADKEFKTISEQLDILSSRGLKIADRSTAYEFLLRNNYYRVSGYSLTLRNHNHFYPSASFQNIVDIYSFDCDLRHILLRFLECIEVSFKSIYAYEFTKKHGPIGYLDADNFTDKTRHAAIMRKGNEQKEKRHASEAYIKHFLDDLHQELPLWAYVDLLTISNISMLYSISEDSVKRSIASRFGLTVSASPRILGDFMHSLTILRNLCAHGSRLFNRLFEQKPSLNKKELALLIKSEDGTVDNSHLFGFILIMRRLLTNEEFLQLKECLIALTMKYPFVSMQHYGFRKDWQNLL